MNGILNRIFIFIGLPAYVSGHLTGWDRGGDNEGMLFLLFQPVKPIRFLFPVKTDYRLEGEGELNKWNWERAIFYIQRALWGNKTFWQFGCVYPKCLQGTQSVFAFCKRNDDNHRFLRDINQGRFNENRKI